MKEENRKKNVKKNYAAFTITYRTQTLLPKVYNNKKPEVISKSIYFIT